MTVTDVETASPRSESTAVGPQPPPPTGPSRGKRGRSRRRWILFSAVGLIVALIVSGGIGFLVYGSTYQPLSWGDTSRVVSPSSIKTIGDGLTDTNVILVGPKGTRGTVVYELDNNGSHPVRILPSSNDELLPWLRLGWEPVTQDGFMIGGTVAQERRFPLTLPAHGSVGLWITVIQPACGPNSGSGITEAIDVRWSALGWHHSTWLPLGPRAFLPLVTCPLKTTLSHIDPDA